MQKLALAVALAAPTLAVAQNADTPVGIAADDWSSIRAAYDTSRHAVYAVEGGHAARNPGQSWVTSFDGRGLLTEPDAGDWTWGLDLVSYGFAGEEHAVTCPVDVNTERATSWTRRRATAGSGATTRSRSQTIAGAKACSGSRLHLVAKPCASSWARLSRSLSTPRPV